MYVRKKLKKKTIKPQKNHWAGFFLKKKTRVIHNPEGNRFLQLISFGFRGATVARLTPDQKAACSNHVGVIG